MFHFHFGDKSGNFKKKQMKSKSQTDQILSRIGDSRLAEELQEAPALLLRLRASNANIESVLLNPRFRSMEWEPEVREVLRFIMKDKFTVHKRAKTSAVEPIEKDLDEIFNS